MVCMCGVWYVCVCMVCGVWYVCVCMVCGVCVCAVCMRTPINLILRTLPCFRAVLKSNRKLSKRLRTRMSVGFTSIFVMGLCARGEYGQF